MASRRLAHKLAVAPLSRPSAISSGLLQPLPVLIGPQLTCPSSTSAHAGALIISLRRTENSADMMAAAGSALLASPSGNTKAAAVPGGPSAAAAVPKRPNRAAGRALLCPAASSSLPTSRPSTRTEPPSIIGRRLINLQHPTVVRYGRGGASQSRPWQLLAAGVDEPVGSHHISFSGGGIYFFWQLGVAKYLLNNYDLSRVGMSGTSCGALCATLTACGVDPHEIVQSAYDLSLENDLWSRPLGLAGIWGRLILEWLEELLPEESGEMCRDRVQIMVTEIPTFQQSAVNDFVSKEDLIAVNMASIHVPVFLDWRVTRKCRGKQCVDGSIPNVVFRKRAKGPEANAVAAGGSGRCIVVDHNMDERLKVSSFGFLKLQEYESVLNMMDLGFTFAEQLDATGEFEGLPAAVGTMDK